MIESLRGDGRLKAGRHLMRGETGLSLSNRLRPHGSTPTRIGSGSSHGGVGADGGSADAGGGMGNIVFAPVGTRVVEFIPPHSSRPCFMGLAGALGFEYHALAPEHAGDSAAFFNHDHMTVPIEELKRVVRLLRKGSTRY